MNSAVYSSIFSHLSDAVGAIIAAMQYRPVKNSPTTFNIGSGELSPLSLLSDELQELVKTTPPLDKKDEGRGNNNSRKKKDSSPSTISKNVIDVERSSAARAASLSSNDYLRWSAKTSLKDGAAKLLAWHLDRSLMFFPPASISEGEVDYSLTHPPVEDADRGEEDEALSIIPLDGKEILTRRGLPTSCDTQNDPTCLQEAHTLFPCASECSTRSCIPSVFDNIITVTHAATEDCYVVLYTMALGYDIEEMTLETEYSDGEEQEYFMETTVCTIAFVPSESKLVRGVIDQVPPKELEKRGVSADDDYETKLKGLNGFLAHRGWALILVDGATQPMMAEDMFLLKLSPARLFHSTVRKAMYIDENFSHTPYPEDAQFLSAETSRGVLKQRTVMGPDAKGRKTKYKLPEEPQRRAVLLISPMRKIPTDVEDSEMPLKEITKSMMKELGFDLDEEGEPNEIRNQREYYERARALINSMDLRSPDPILRHKIEIKDFIRSRWIVHHLKLEEGHQIRCEWYREHVKWNTHLDQLSFAYIMAKRELVRKIIMRQLPPPPQTEQQLSILQQIIRIKSDAHEWHPIFSAEGLVDALHHSQIAPEAIPVNLFDLPDNEIYDVHPDAAFSDEISTYYVRIMSDDRMLESRRKWIKGRK